ncbi:MAG: hypothetical protein FJ335_03100 [Sphingomonadales bacterium]|nr:hypothetical protein [Sphingomonadales bacterium]
MTARSYVSLIAIGMASGCAPPARIAVPPSLYSQDWTDPVRAGTPTVADQSLGALLGSPELDALIATARRDSPTLRAGDARIQQAAGLLTTARAAAMPVVTATAQPNGTRLPGQGDLFSFDRSFASIDASLDPDIFGRNRALGRAAADRLRAARLDRVAAEIALESQVALAFVQRATLARRLSLLSTSLTQAAELDRIMRIRQREGDATRVDVGLQAIRLTQLRAEQTRLSEALLETRTSLAVLIGAETPGFTVETAVLDDLVAPALAAPPPAVLIERRPDVRAAEARLTAAGGDVAAARRAFYPSLNLSASLLATTAAIGPLVPFARIGQDLLAPIFARSKLRGDLAVSVGQQAEAVELYRQAVLEALRGVENALSSIRHARAREALLADVEAEARTTTALARRQYLEGDVDLQRLLDAQDLLISAQDARALAMQELLTATIALYAATAT